MAGRRFPVVVVAVAAVIGATGFGAQTALGSVPAGTQPWTQISANTAISSGSAGLLRTSDGRLHVVWPSHDGTAGYSLHYSTLGTRDLLISVGPIVTNWKGISLYPRLVPTAGGGMRLIFNGGNGTAASPFNLGAVYSATAGKTGATWALTPGSMSQSKLIPATDDAAVTEADGTPVAGWAAGGAFDYHVGLDSTAPATAPDVSVSAGTGGVVVGPTMVRDKIGEVWASWFNASGTATQGYYVDRILPTTTALLKAPSSGGATLADNEPRQAVAFAARVGGGAYLAYCVPTTIGPCSHINLWRAGGTKVLTVPQSNTGKASHVAIAAAPGGYLWIAWFDTGLQKIRVVRTTAGATGFGTVHTFSTPTNMIAFTGLQGDASLGPIDLIALVNRSTAHSTPAYWATEVRP